MVPPVHCVPGQWTAAPAEVATLPIAPWSQHNKVVGAALSRNPDHMKGRDGGLERG